VFESQDPLIWAGLIVAILVFLAIDLGLAHRQVHTISMREALYWTGGWISLAVVFGALVYFWMGARSALEYATGYLLELSLSVDNLFVFAVIFTALGVPEIYRHRVLFWGIIGALTMRGIFIVSGSALLETFHWSVYLFGGLLVFAAIRMTRQSGHPHPGGAPALVFLARVVPMSPHYHGSAFITTINGRKVGTALLAAVVLVELSDIMFAIDSVPAILAVTRDPFLVFASNAFAILGLRSMYFVLSGVLNRFHFLKYGLAVILGFVGLKLMLSDVVELPFWSSIVVIVTCIGVSILASLIWTSDLAIEPETRT
jgi:tellurite resistance protein TerC